MQICQQGGARRGHMNAMLPDDEGWPRIFEEENHLELDVLKTLIECRMRHGLEQRAAILKELQRRGCC